MILGQRRNAMVLNETGSQPPHAGVPGKTEKKIMEPPPINLPTEPIFTITPPHLPPSQIQKAQINANTPKFLPTQPTTPLPGEVLSSPPITVSRHSSVPYKAEYAEQMMQYFESREKTRIVTDSMVWKNGEVANKEREVANPPPQFSEFARSIKTTHRQLKAWCKMYPDFAEAYTACQEIFKEFLIANGLVGHYGSQMAIFTAKNETDMKDKSTVDHRSWDMKDILDRLERGEDTNRLELSTGEE